MEVIKVKNPVLVGTVTALIGNTIFGFSFMFSRIALNVTVPFVMLMYRFIGAFLGMSIMAIISKKQNRQDWMRFSVDRKRVKPLLLLGLVQPVLYFLCESYGISLTNATVSGVVIALVPIISLGAGALFLHERPTAAQVGFSSLSILGVILMTLQQSAGSRIHPLGVLLLVGAVLTGTAFKIMSRSMASRYSAFERTYVMMTVAAITFTILALWTCRHNITDIIAPLRSAPFMASIGYLSILSSIAAFMLLNYSGNLLPVSKTSAFSNLTTVLSVFAGAIFLGETLTVLSVIASVIIIFGVYGVQKFDRKAGH